MVIEEILAKVSGEKIRDIWYRPAGEVPTDPARRWHGPIHNVDIDVKIFTTNHALTISWARDHLIEGLALEIQDLPLQNSFEEEWCAVSKIAEWAPFLSKSITGFSPVWHKINPADSAALWSMRMEVSAGSSLVLALGELDLSGKPTYHPDGILVFFSTDLARRYRINSSIFSAWGEVPELPPGALNS
ncbi:hypothetical protein [Actinoplanes palleronii]|nr:hypothetical protein [Actinoplanes palleronii]